MLDLKEMEQIIWKREHVCKGAKEKVWAPGGAGGEAAGVPGAGEKQAGQERGFSPREVRILRGLNQWSGTMLRITLAFC